MTSKAAGWWGQGPAPWERWPGTTIETPAKWVAGRRWTDADGGPHVGRWESPDGRFYFDDYDAGRAADFFSTYLSHHIGEFAGQPFRLMPYQELLLTRPLFGWKRVSDGYRRFQKVFAFLPKGAGKSPWASGTGLYLLLCDREPAAEVYALANEKNQARVVHTNAKNMVEDAQELLDQCEVLRDSIFVRGTRSIYQVLSADAATKHGFRPHGMLFDEFHGQPNRDLYEAFRKSMAKRRQPVLVITTHAGTDDESICYEEYEYAKRVLSGTVDDPKCLPVLFEAKDGEDWMAPTTWRRVNPGLGVTVHEDAIEAECKEAAVEPRKRNDFLRFHLNRWTNQATAWLVLDWWDQCRGEIEPDAVLGKLPCGGGLDLAQKYDLACFALTFQHPVPSVLPVEVVGGETPQEAVVSSVELNYRITLLPFFWIPEDTMHERERQDGVPYSDWVRRGLVTATEGSVIDYSRIFSDITTKIIPRFASAKQAVIGYDPAFATDIAQNLRDRAGLKVMEVLQGYSHMSEACHVFEALVRAGRVAHGGNRVLRHHVENVAVKRDDAGRLRPVKPKRPGKHIDGVMAALMGLKSLSSSPPQPSYSFAVFGGRGRPASPPDSFVLGRPSARTHV